jgi:hypothetical protein
VTHHRSQSTQPDFAPCEYNTGSFSYEHAHEHEGHWYCRICGCPKWKLARLDGGKLAYPALACPRGKFTAVTVSAGEAGG